MSIGGGELMQAYCVTDDRPLSDTPAQLGDPSIGSRPSQDFDDMVGKDYPGCGGSDHDGYGLSPEQMPPETQALAGDDLEMPGPAEEPVPVDDSINGRIDDPMDMSGPDASTPTDTTPDTSTPDIFAGPPDMPYGGMSALNQTLERIVAVLERLLALIEDLGGFRPDTEHANPKIGPPASMLTPPMMPEPEPVDPKSAPDGSASDRHGGGGCSGDHEGPSGDRGPRDMSPPKSNDNPPPQDRDTPDAREPDSPTNVDDLPPADTAGDPLKERISGGTGEPLRDMDPDLEGTQIYAVLDSDMSSADRSKTIEALENWEQASGGELDFMIFDEGEQPSGQDYMIIESVKPDNTNIAGVADVGRSPDGVTQAEFERGSNVAIIMHEIGHMLGLDHGDGVMQAVNAKERISQNNLAELSDLYPGVNVA